MANYYFSASGLTSNTGTSSSSPWPINKFTITGVAGDVLYINKGDSFNVNITYSRSGSSGNPITIDAYGSGNNPEFNGSGSTSTPALTITGSYITINNLVVKNTGLYCPAPFVVNGGHDIKLYNCFAGYGMRGMNILNTTGNIVIDTCWFSNFTSPNSTNTQVGNGGGSGVQWNNCSGSGNKTINSKFYTIVGSGSNPNPGVGDVISHYKCYFGTGDTFAGVGSFGYEAANNKVRGGGSDPSGYAGTVGGDVGGSNQYIHDNYFINAGKVGAQVQGGTNINMSNNYVYSKVLPYTSVGIAFGNYSNLPVSNVTIGGNKINFYSASNSRVYNKWWDGSAKTYPAFQPTNWTTNTADNTSDPASYDALIPDPLFAYGDWNTSSGLVFGALPTKNYGDADFAPGATSSHTITYTSSNVSVATIVGGNIHIAGAGSCNITADDGTTSIVQGLTVNKITVTVTANNQTKIYGSSNPSLTLSYSGFASGESSAYLITLATASTSATTSSVVGTYSIVPSGGSSNNYNLSYVNRNITVTKANLTITGNNATKVYGTSNPSLSVTYSGFVVGDTSSNLITQAVATCPATISSSVGSYSVIPSGASSSNYSFNYINGILSVTQASLTVSADNKTKTTGAANPTLTMSYSGFLNGDTSSSITSPSISTTATTGSSAGTYPITLSGGSSTNYSLILVSGTLTVSGVGLVFNAISSKVYGVADFSPGATSSSSISYTSSNTSVATIVGSNIHIIGAGTSTITANDGVTSLPQTLTVTKANLTITPDNHIIVAGTIIPILSVSYNGFVYSDTSANLTTGSTVTTTATSSSPVGAYPITASSAVSNNYNISYIAGTLSIIPNGQIIIHFPIRLL